MTTSHKHLLARKLGFLFYLILLPTMAFAQLEVTDTFSNQQLVQKLAGKGVTISNVTVDCPSGPDGAAHGFFDASDANLDLSEGLLLTSGAITNAYGPNDQSGTTTINNTPGDPDLDQILTNDSTFDACVVEFDFVPNGDTLKFNYSLGSEEYPEYVCADKNDVFGFFISGPNPNGPAYNKENIATVPSTNLPVAINTVNGGQAGSQGSSGNCTSLSYSQYYTDNCNCSGAPPPPPSAPFNTDSFYIEYDGFTDGLVAKQSVVQCQTYNLKLALGDVGDRLWDSGVFVESIISTEKGIKSTTAGNSAFGNAVEGCLDGLFTITLDKPLSDTSIVDIDIGGTATNGTDYAAIPDSVIFPPGDTLQQITIDAVDDGITEPIESVVINVFNNCNKPSVSDTIFIQDSINLSTGKPDSLTLCRGESVQFNASGAISYNWSPPDWLSTTTGKAPLATPDSSITYHVSTQVGSCVDKDSTYIEVIPSNYSVNLKSDTNLCLNQSAQLDPNVQPPGNYDYNWSPPEGLSDTTIANPTASPTDSITYYLDVSNALCTISDTIDVNVVGAAPNLTASADKDTICPGEDVELSVAVGPGACGTNNSTCSGTVNNKTIGTNNNPITDGTPYNGLYEDSRVQYLLRSSELNAMGMNAGVIKEIAFDIAQKNSNVPYNNFTIKMGCTSLSDFSSTTDFVSGLDIVFTPKQVSTTNGWNTHVLDNGYDWDGTSNLIVEVCYDNNNWTSEDNVNATSSTYTSVMYNYGDGLSGCSISSSSAPNFGKTSDRPNIRFGVCKADFSNVNFSWSPASLVNDDTAQTTTANPFQTTTFNVEVDNGKGCVENSNVTVATDTSLSVRATPDTSFCPGKSVQLNAATKGNPGPAPLSCGTNASSCSSPSVNTVGTGTNTTTTPSPYIGNSNGGTKARMQFIYRASDLNAQGVTAGIISSLSFDVATDQSPDSFRNMTIRMGCTTKDSFSDPDSFITNLSTVYSSTGFVTSTGWNTHQLDNTYDWDGSSHLVIEVCYATSQNKKSGGGGSDLINTSATGYNSVMFRNDQFGSGAGCDFTYNNITVINDNRPNIQLDMCDPPPGQFSYTWAPSTGLDSPNVQSPVATVFSSTDYVVSVTDGKCTVRDTATVSITGGYNLTVDGNSIGCTGKQFGNAWATASGGVAPYSFQWNNGATSDSIDSLNAGTYVVTVTDDEGCKQIDSFSVTNTAPLVIDSIVTTDVPCYNDSSGSAIVNASGGTSPFSYIWNNGDTTQTIKDLPADTFSVTVTDVGGCSDADTIIIQEPPKLNASIDSSKDPSCYGSTDGMATVNVSGGSPPYTYQWDDSSSQTTPTASGLPDGEYTVTVTDDSGCVAIDTTVLVEPDSFTITLTTEQAISCYGAQDGVVSASVGGDTSKHSFTWANQNGPMATGLDAGKHTVTVTTDSSGCNQTASITLSQPDSIQLTTTETDVLCFGDSTGSASITASGDNGPPFSYNWSTGDTTTSISGLPAGTYDVSVTDTNSCTNEATVVIDQPSALQLSTSTTPLSCNNSSDGSATVDVSGGKTPYSYKWNDTDSQTTSTAKELEAGNYSVTVTDQNGCTATATALVGQPNPVAVQELDVVDESCPDAVDGAVFAKATGGTSPYSYVLQNDTSMEGAFNGLKGGKQYKLTTIDDNGCQSDTLVRVNQPNEVVVDFDRDQLTVKLGQGQRLKPILMPADTGAYSYRWEPSTGLSCLDCKQPVANPYQETNYELTVYDQNGCQYSETILVNVANPEVLYIPNAFTPDGNERNDEFKIYGEAINDIHLEVFNRWGELVFETKDPSEGWDGTYKGSDAPSGVYLYKARIRYIDGTSKEKQGSITLIR